MQLQCWQERLLQQRRRDVRYLVHFQLSPQLALKVTLVASQDQIRHRYGRNCLVDLDLPPVLCSCSVGKNGFCSSAFPRPVAGGSLL